MASDKLVFDNIKEMRGNIEKARKAQSGKVIAFYNLGMSANEIAGKLGMLSGDVQQILLKYKKEGG